MPIVSGASSGSIRPFGFTYGAKPAWVDNTLADFRYLDSYSDTVQASGTAPVTYSIASGSLPTGLSLNQSTGAISGSTTASGTYNFTVQARNHLGTITQPFTKTVPLAPTPPTFVAAGGFTQGLQTISITMPSRQAGDIAFVTWHAWELYFANQYDTGSAPGYTQISKDYASASVLQDDSTIFQQYIFSGQFYRVMTNTSADNFSYTMPQTFNTTLQWLIVRPAAGMTFSVVGDNPGGQTYGISPYVIPPPTKPWQVLKSFAANILPKTILLTHDPLGMNYSGITHVAGTVPVVEQWVSTISNQTPMVQSNYSQYTRSYIVGLVDSGANVAGVGTFSKASGSNYWHNNSHIVATWNRV